MAKVVFISSLYHPHIIGGAEAVVQTLAEELTARGHSAVVITLAQGTAPGVDDVNGVRVHRVRTANVYTPFIGEGKQPGHMRMLWHLRDAYNPAMGREVGRILDLEKPDWVSSQAIIGFSVAAWAAVKQRGIGLSHTLHDYYLMCPRTMMYRETACVQRCTSCLVMSEPKRLSSRHVEVDVVMGISQFVLDRHLAAGYFPNARPVVIHNASKPIASAAPQRAHVAGAPLVLGYIGRIDESKGLEVLLAALSQLPAGGWQLRVAGRGEPEYLRKLQERYPLARVSYLGFTQREEFYASVDVVVVPSLWDEPFGMTAIEPLGFGVPVIVAQAGGLPEIIEGSGAGWLVPKGDPSALAERLRSLIAGQWDREAMRASALSRVKDFLPARQAEQFLEATGLRVPSTQVRTASP